MLGNFLQRRLDRAGDVEPRALGCRSCAPISPAKTDCTSYLAMEKINLGLNLSGARLVTALAQFVEFLAKIDESALVFLLGFGVEHLAGIAESTDADSSVAE